MSDQATTPKLHNYWHTIKRLLKLIVSQHRIRLIIVVISIVFSAIAGVVGVALLKYLFDDVITPLVGQENPDYSDLTTMIIVMGSVYYSSVLADYIYNRLMIVVSQDTLKDIRDRMFQLMQSLPISFFDQHTHGELMNYYTNDTDTLEDSVSRNIPEVFSLSISIAATLYAMLSLSLYLTAMVAMIIIIMFLCVKFITLRSFKYFSAQQRDIANVNGYIEEMLAGQKVIKSFCHETATAKQFYDINSTLCNSSTKARKYANILMPVISNLGNIQYVLISIVGGILIVNQIGSLTVGTIVSFLQLGVTFAAKVSQLSQQLHSMVTALAGAERIFNLLDQTPESNTGKISLVNTTTTADNNITEQAQYSGTWAWKYPQADGSVRYIKLQGKVMAEHMSFGYRPDKPVLQDINFIAEPGHKIAFVGHTGAGKTTITNLINRFYDIQQGRIYLDGINIQDIDKNSLRHAVALVLQDTHLFSGTIMENIRYGKLTATDDEVYTAAKLANADQFIQLLPEKYNTFINGTGEELSQGQRQLLSIARAAIANAPILILDEATSSIDTYTEVLVQQGMDSLMQGRTVLVIAHRLSTIRNADTIVVLQHGKIIEQGKHEELMNNHNIYYQLYTGDIELD